MSVSMSVSRKSLCLCQISIKKDKKYIQFNSFIFNFECIQCTYWIIYRFALEENLLNNLQLCKFVTLFCTDLYHEHKLLKCFGLRLLKCFGLYWKLRWWIGNIKGHSQVISNMSFTVAIKGSSCNNLAHATITKSLPFHHFPWPNFENNLYMIQNYILLNVGAMV